MIGEVGHAKHRQAREFRIVQHALASGSSSPASDPLLSVAGAETIGTVSSPSNILTVTVTVNDEGRPGYSITRGGRPIVTESRLGFLLTDAPKLERNFRGDGVADAQLRRDLGAAVGRASLRAQSLQRAARAADREESRPDARFDRRVPRLRRRRRLSLRVSGSAAAARREHRRRADRVRRRRARHRVVDSRRRMESLRISLQQDAARAKSRRRTRRSRSAPTQACTSRSTKRRWSTTRRCGCAVSTARG